MKYVIEDYWKQHPKEHRFYSEKMFRTTLLRGIRQWAGNVDQWALNDVWLAMDRIGRLDDDVAFHPYWSNGDTVSPKPATALVSYYQRPGKALLFVADTSHTDVDQTVALKLGDEFTSAVDAVAAEPVALKGRTLALTVPADLYRAVLLTK